MPHAVHGGKREQYRESEIALQAAHQVKYRYRGCHDQAGRIDDQAHQAKPLKQFDHQQFERPAIRKPWPAGELAGEGIDVGYGVMLKDPFPSAQMPPDVGIDDAGTSEADEDRNSEQHREHQALGEPLGCAVGGGRSW